mmetsp:Transcript_48486/g.97108  ORF Transcript_48486/g.97108 Transcript_48486/m.97108 type:complete len:129 (+) Transcript_48486:895-1281(+)
MITDKLFSASSELQVFPTEGRALSKFLTQCAAPLQLTMFKQVFLPKQASWKGPSQSARDTVFGYLAKHACLSEFNTVPQDCTRASALSKCSLLSVVSLILGSCIVSGPVRCSAADGSVVLMLMRVLLF